MKFALRQGTHIDAMIEFSIDVNDALARCYEKILKVFGRDEFSSNLQSRVCRLTKEAIEDSRFVQSVGMKRPVPIELIYQPSRLAAEEYTGRGASKYYTYDQLIDFPDSVIVQGAPGAGKTTLAHRIYLELLHSNAAHPFLFTLRRPESIEDLAALVESSKKLKTTADAHKDLVWIVDGYDELPRIGRRRVSRLLAQLVGQGLGRFILTCRSHYEVIDLKARYLYVQPFTITEAEEYIKSFCRSYGANFNASEFARELSERGFEDFLSSPLMLTLACILRTSPAQTLPRKTVNLVSRALEVLTYQWDESKFVSREAVEPVEGEERIKCLKRIAFAFESPSGSAELAQTEARKQLQLMHYSKVNPLKLLRETAQWYGIFVPAADGEWTFAHKTIHDYLAAQYWVETGAFNQALNISKWNTRVAYAACLISDATRVIVSSLQRSEGMEVLVECLLNGAAFDQASVAQALAKRLASNKFRGQFTIKLDGPSNAITAELQLPSDFVRHASNDFLAAMLETGNMAAYGLAMSEVQSRRLKYTKAMPTGVRDITFKVYRGTRPPIIFKNAQMLV